MIPMKRLVMTIFFFFSVPAFGAEVPDRVLQAARDFGGLDTVVSAARVEVPVSHTRYYEIRGITRENGVSRHKLLAVDDRTGEVVRMVRLNPRYDRYETDVRIMAQDVMGIITEFLREKDLSIPPGFTLRRDDSNQAVTRHQFGPEYFYQVVFEHRAAGVLIRPDFILFKVGATFGEVHMYSKVEHPVLTATEPAIAAGRAVGLARRFLSSSTGFDPSMPAEAPGLAVVYPNRCFEGRGWIWTDAQALCWIVPFTGPGDGGRAVSVWVDALGGDIRGGEIYERPRDELFGVGDQTGDLDIWLGPFAEMQFNNVSHRNGYKNEVVAAITNPDNAVFMLQTHGSYGSAVLTNGRLYPSDIGDNTLFWAIVSCCYSGDSATNGNSFRTQFIEHGTLLFTGYVGSINPDPYERCLAYYLELGLDFANAHDLARAQSNPDFQIVYTWRNSTHYNQIRLAPLQVDATGPSSCDPGDTFQVTTNVINREDALHDQARNVTAELICPGGFTVTSGAGSQSLGHISWNQQGSAVWQVRADSGVANGVYTFDVIVRSDNLGVEVDDPDNPHHRFQVSVPCLLEGAIAVGPGPAPQNPPRARVFPPHQDANHKFEFNAYGPQRFGLNLTCGDVDGDGGDEIVTGAGPGAVFGPHVRGFEVNGDPRPGLNFIAYGTRKWGVHVAAGDLDLDGYDEIITGAGPGRVFGPHVRAFNYDGTPSVRPMAGVSFLAYGSRQWGVNADCGDIDADGFDEIVTGPGPGLTYGPHVRAWNVDGGQAREVPNVNFFASDLHAYGVVVGCGDVDGDGFAEILTAPGPGEDFFAHIQGWNYDGAAVSHLPGCQFVAWPPVQVRYGARVFAGADLDQDGRSELVIGAGPDPDAGPLVKVFQYDGSGVAFRFSLSSFATEWTHGASVAAGRF
jgi:hypothetical protein